MIIGSYVLHLYCDFCQRPRRHTQDGSERCDEFVGGSRQGAYRRARKAGWRIHESRDKAECPTCVGESTGG